MRKHHELAGKKCVNKKPRLAYGGLVVHAHEETISEKPKTSHTPTVGLEPTTTRLRALRSTD